MDNVEKGGCDINMVGWSGYGRVKKGSNFAPNNMDSNYRTIYACMRINGVRTMRGASR